MGWPVGSFPPVGCGKLSVHRWHVLPDCVVLCVPLYDTPLSAPYEQSTSGRSGGSGGSGGGEGGAGEGGGDGDAHAGMLHAPKLAAV